VETQHAGETSFVPSPMAGAEILSAIFQGSPFSKQIPPVRIVTQLNASK